MSRRHSVPIAAVLSVSLLLQDTLREDCDSSDDCEKNCCVSRVVAPVFFVVFVLVAQFVLVNVVVAVLMKHLEVRPHTISLDKMLGVVTVTSTLKVSRHKVASLRNETC